MPPPPAWWQLPFTASAPSSAGLAPRPVSVGLFLLHVPLPLEDVTAAGPRARRASCCLSLVGLGGSLSNDPKAYGSSLGLSLVLGCGCGMLSPHPCGRCLCEHRPCHLGRAGPVCACRTPPPPSAAGWLYSLLVARGGLGGAGRGRGLSHRSAARTASRSRHALASACCPQCSSRCVPFRGDELSSGSGSGSSAGPSSLPAPTDAWAMPPRRPDGGIPAAVRPGVGSVLVVWSCCSAGRVCFTGG